MTLSGSSSRILDQDIHNRLLQIDGKLHELMSLAAKIDATTCSLSDATQPLSERFEVKREKKINETKSDSTCATSAHETSSYGAPFAIRSVKTNPTFGASRKLPKALSLSPLGREPDFADCSDSGTRSWFTDNGAAKNVIEDAEPDTEPRRISVNSVRTARSIKSVRSFHAVNSMSTVFSGKASATVASSSASLGSFRASQGTDVSKTNTADIIEELKQERGGLFKSLNSRSALAEGAWLFLSNPDSSRGAYFYSHSMNPLILASIIFTLMQSIDPAPLSASTGLHVEIGLDALLAIDIILRFVFYPNRVVFLRDMYNVIDLLCLLLLPIRCLMPLFQQASQWGNSDVNFEVIVVGLSPTLRLLKLLRRFHKFHLVLRAFQDAFEALPVLLYTLTMIWLFFGALLFFVESRDNLEELPTALWLTIVTMGTVGYGDLAPKRTEGRIVVTILIIVSALYMSIPVGIIGNAFNRVWENRVYLLTIQRTRNSISQLGYTPYDMVSLFHRFGNQTTNELNFRQFRRMMKTMKVGLSEDKLLELFETFDTDDGGTVDAREFLRAVYPVAYCDIYGREIPERTSSERFSDVPEEHNTLTKSSNGSRGFKSSSNVGQTA